MLQTVLVVDDEEAVLNLVYLILKGAGYNLLRASSGREAIALCQNNTGPVHLALLDVMMPGMTGPELRICLRDHLPSARVLFMSGHSYDQIARHGIDADQVELLAKPFTTAKLLGCVEGMLAETCRRSGDV